MSEGQTQEVTQIVFIRKHPELEPILEELGPVLTSEDVLQIDELAVLFGGITEPLTRTCQKGSKMYDELTQDPKYVEKEFHHIPKEVHQVEEAFYFSSVFPDSENENN